jgi:site-specific DNA-methyltransferase (adenine-specific)/modification methylase
MNGMKLILGDCLEEMKKMPNKSVDCVITSPPYNMRLRIRNGEYTEREWAEHFSKKYDEFHDALPMKEYQEFHTRVIKELLRISPIVFWNISIVTGSKEALFKIIGEFAREITDIVVWDKGFGQPAMNNGVLNRGYELIVIFEAERKNGRTFNKYCFDRGTMPDIWRMGRGGKENEKNHAATFPCELAERIIIGWTKTDDVILDPFCGTGTTGVACKRLNRDFIGIEISPKYLEIAKTRIEKQTPPLF